MLRNYQLFIDCICSKECISELSAISDSEASYYTFRIRHFEMLTLPSCKHDLVIYDLSGAPISRDTMKLLVDYYE